MNNIEIYEMKKFEDIKHIDKRGNEYWKARELMPLLEYKKWRCFSAVIDKAKNVCLLSNMDINSNFCMYTKVINVGKIKKSILDYKLSRYACYLIFLNANPKYKAVALAKTYIAIQTRKQELSEKDYN